MSADDHWMHVYVMLSRVKTLEQILVYGAFSILRGRGGMGRYVFVLISRDRSARFAIARALHVGTACLGAMRYVKDR
jgi:hypothetical protein